MFEVIPTGAALGAEIRGVDLTQEIDDATFQQVKAAFYRHEVVFFRGRELTDDDHIRFSARIGELRKLPLARGRHDLRPEIHIVSNIKEGDKYIGSYDSGMFWHTDGAYAENPHAASLLRAIEVPYDHHGPLGATAFASMTAAYDALSAAMKKRIDGLHALHSLTLRDQKSLQAGHRREERSAEQKKNAEAAHPVVRTHPVTGRKCLYVSEGYTVRILDVPEDESKDLLAELTAHCVQPQFLYIHSWRVHDLVMWDDCSTQHKATFDYALPQRRRMHRTTVMQSTATERS